MCTSKLRFFDFQNPMDRPSAYENGINVIHNVVRSVHRQTRFGYKGASTILDKTERWRLEVRLLTKPRLCLCILLGISCLPKDRKQSSPHAWVSNALDSVATSGWKNSNTLKFCQIIHQESLHQLNGMACVTGLQHRFLGKALSKNQNSSFF